jgi:cytochrome P450
MFLSDQFLALLLRSLVALAVLYQVTWTYARLRDVPGPFIAKFTNLWRLLVVWRRDSHDTYLELHKKHGDLVRIGPNCVSISRPDMIQTIYGIQKGYVKSDFYAVWQNMIDGKRSPSLVFTTDEQQHAMLRRPVAGAFALSTLVDFEPLIDSTTAVFLTRLDELFSNTGKACDLGVWLQWFAFDIIGELTFSKRLGFMERAEDVEGITKSVAANFDRCSVLGQMPWLDLVTYKNPLYQRFFAKPVSSPIVSFGQRRLQERFDDKDEQECNDFNIPDTSLRSKVLHGTIPSKPDFLSRFLQLRKEQPEVVTERQVLTYLFANINAGSDTIGSTLRAVFYYLLKYPESSAGLLRELAGARKASKLSTPTPTWTECQALPYLNAVVKEALRLNPALALPLERVVPAAGLQIGDVFLPPGTIVGINPWVLQRDKRIFGEDAEQWKPERWLSYDAEKAKYMDHHILSFGAGKRTCLGRNIAMLELLKVVPALLLRYDMKLAHPKREWKVHNAWAVRQEGLDVLLKRRD